jgi:hypothetical protein
MISIITIMRKLIFIIALFFSTSLLAEVFNCEMILTSEKWGNQKYKLLVDTGDEDDSYLGTFDENGNIKEVIQVRCKYRKYIFGYRKSLLIR